MILVPFITSCLFFSCAGIEAKSSGGTEVCQSGGSASTSISLSHSEPVGWPVPKFASPLLLLGLSDNLLLFETKELARITPPDVVTYFEDRLEFEELPEFVAIP